MNAECLHCRDGRLHPFYVYLAIEVRVSTNTGKRTVSAFIDYAHHPDLAVRLFNYLRANSNWRQHLVMFIGPFDDSAAAIRDLWRRSKRTIPNRIAGGGELAQRYKVNIVLHEPDWPKLV